MQKTEPIESAEPVARGEKVVLRYFEPADAELLWASMDDRESMRLTGTHSTFTREQIDAYVQRQMALKHESIESTDRAAFVIARPNNLSALGEVVINNIDRPNNAASIRIALFSPSQFGQGLGTEAMRLMVDYGFTRLGLHRIELQVYAFNPRAIRCYEKVGFRREGILRDALRWDGEYVDAIVMSVLDCNR